MKPSVKTLTLDETIAVFVMQSLILAARFSNNDKISYAKGRHTLYLIVTSTIMQQRIFNTYLPTVYSI